ncbi:hypothetical protein Cgig2_012969 [Carnegiea gigantea]|uniref:Uncharacterized protein n=1 Tax=Carnegiea gigantea TaxID=171969 RepID=A0A9Q1K1Y2_9CARY|nr:hypothetical protein Cgig2_012969 [Carnegiea gigantea]
MGQNEAALPGEIRDPKSLKSELKANAKERAQTRGRSNRAREENQRRAHGHVVPQQITMTSGRTPFPLSHSIPLLSLLSLVAATVFGFSLSFLSLFLPLLQPLFLPCSLNLSLFFCPYYCHCFCPCCCFFSFSLCKCLPVIFRCCYDLSFVVG